MQDREKHNGGRVVVELQVRRFRCNEPACTETAFVEQVTRLTFRARTAEPGAASGSAAGGADPGQPGRARLADALAALVSRSALLWLIPAVPERAPATPRVLIDYSDTPSRAVFDNSRAGVSSLREVTPSFA